MSEDSWGSFKRRIYYRNIIVDLQLARKNLRHIREQRTDEKTNLLISPTVFILNQIELRPDKVVFVDIEVNIDQSDVKRAREAANKIKKGELQDFNHKIITDLLDDIEEAIENEISGTFPTR